MDVILLNETLAGIRRSQSLRPDHLQGGVEVQIKMLREIDDPHAAASMKSHGAKIPDDFRQFILGFEARPVGLQLRHLWIGRQFLQTIKQSIKSFRHHDRIRAGHERCLSQHRANGCCQSVEFCGRGWVGNPVLVVCIRQSRVSRPPQNFTICGHYSISRRPARRRVHTKSYRTGVTLRARHRPVPESFRPSIQITP